MNLLNKLVYSKFISSWMWPLDLDFYKYFVIPWTYPKAHECLSKYLISGKMYTAKVLANSDKSIARYGNSELRIMLGNEHNDKSEGNSPELSKRLSQILKINDPNLMIGLPDAFISINQFNNRVKKAWGKFVVKYYKSILPYLNINTHYYDANVMRPYSDYYNKSDSGKIFKNLKKIWANKKILLVEGEKTRLGVGNDLFNDAKVIKRIECPVTHAFKSYGKILSNVLNFLNKHNGYITLISLGATATVLSYDVYKHGYRALDTGHLDTEYIWYLMKATKPVNIPYKYTNESTIRKPTKVFKNKKYYNEIIKIIK